MRSSDSFCRYCKHVDLAHDDGTGFPGYSLTYCKECPRHICFNPELFVWDNDTLEAI